jgi:hypothetical protein
VDNPVGYWWGGGRKAAFTRPAPSLHAKRAENKADAFAAAFFLDIREKG